MNFIHLHLVQRNVGFSKLDVAHLWFDKNLKSNHPSWSQICRTNVYKSLNNLYHILRYYPFYGDIEEKNKFIIDIYKDAYFALIEIVKKIYATCVSSNLNKKEVKFIIFLSFM